MVVLGLLLLLAAVGVGADVAIKNTASIDVNAFGQTFSLSPGWLFVVGAVTGAVALLGLSMMLTGGARARRRRRSLAETRSSVGELQADRDRLAEEVERERAARVSAEQAASAHTRRAWVGDPAAMGADGGELQSAGSGHGWFGRHR